MNRFLFIVALAALLGQAAASQGTLEPDEGSVLETARSKYFSEKELPERDESLPQGGETEAAESPAKARERPYAPFVLSLVPGLSFPFGTYDATVHLGLVGSLAGSVEGLQLANVFAIAEAEVEGFQAAGVFSLAGGAVEGVQAAGVFTIAGGAIEGFQGAGVFNIADGEVDGFQAAGVFNIAGDLDGFQAAGVFNVAERVEGSQVAAVLNVAEELDGLQIGLVNIADRMDGVQIGLVNIALSPGLSSTGGFYEPDTDYLYGALQSGSRRLYALISAGMPREDWGRRSRDLLLGYGLGTRLELGQACLDLDLSALSLVGPQLPAIGEALDEGRPLADEAASDLIPFPSLRACLGLPLAGKLRLVGGLKVDFDLADAPRLPEALKRGRAHSSELFGVDYRAWTKLYLGLAF
ncbi:MAG TPA: hypothetical protein PLB91_12260 [Spirochaetales bacterium]|nr:hypothetical protein [Spirochaetales bacterium]HRY54767.1 hypothetical protein [Spirochaetia bacterium]HRZ64301.1 hypothetical protein [Spirochaetia bacterium]